MSLVVFEQSEVACGPSRDFTLEVATALVDLKSRGLRAASWCGPGSIWIEQFVGVVEAGGEIIEILPKIGSLGWEGARRSLLGMLAVTQDLKVHSAGLAGYLNSEEPFIAALARLYTERLLEAVRRGLRQEYVLVQEDLACLRGRVNWPAQAIRHARGRVEFECEFDDRSVDTSLNRALKAALRTSSRVLGSAADNRLVNELRLALADVSDTTPDAKTLRTLTTDRSSVGLRPLLTLAKLILGDRSPELGRSTQPLRDAFSVIWDMNVLFEEFVGRTLAVALAPRGFDVLLQDEARFARETSNRGHLWLRPDIVVRAAGRPVAVADTKWKRLQPSQANLGISSGDVYQVCAYARQYATDRAYLLYPYHPDLGAPGELRRFLISGDGDLQVSVVALDLENLDGVDRELTGAFAGLAVAA